MKIIYLHQYFNTPDMAGGTRSYEMARRMVAAGHEVHVITSSRDEHATGSWVTNQVEGIYVHWYPVAYSNKMPFAKRIIAFFKFAIASSQRAMSIHNDIVFATSTPLTIAIPAIIASRWRRVPMVFEVRDLWPEMPIAMGALRNPMAIFFAKWLEKTAYTNSHAINALSPGMRDGIVAAGYPRENVSVIPNSADISLFRVPASEGTRFRDAREWLDEKDPLILYAGTFGLINDVASLVNLAAALKQINSKVKILAIGGGVRFDEVLGYAKDSGVLNVNFFMEGYLPKKDMPAAYSAATICSSFFLDLPEMRKNSSNKFFDALAAGKPLLINYSGWMRDLINESGCGLSVWNMSPPLAALELEKRLYDEQWLKEASEASSSLAEKYFDRDVLANQLISVLESTVGGKAYAAESIASGLYRS